MSMYVAVTMGLYGGDALFSHRAEKVDGTHPADLLRVYEQLLDEAAGVVRNGLRADLQNLGIAPLTAAEKLRAIEKIVTDESYAGPMQAIAEVLKR